MPPDTPNSPQPPGKSPDGFSRTFARDPGRARIGLLPERRVWVALGSAAGLVAAVALLAPLAQQGLRMSADDTRVAAADVQSPSPEPVASKSAGASPSASPEHTKASPKPEKKATQEPAEQPAAPPAQPKHKDPAPPPKSTHGDSAPKGGAKGSPPHPAKISGPSGAITGMNGTCLDVAYGKSANGTQVQVHGCNGAPAQKFTMASDGTVRAVGKCMDVVNGATSDGSLIHLWDCNGSPSQQWVFSPANDLVNRQADKCLDIRAANTSDGTRVQIANCSGNPAQKWNGPA
ncbi:ricin-type beta-trefoil lectin domain protein [Streptomyces sp. NPDC048644]|uniref:ricin-type beta-trefoil lectin domain protein n=1 Tax=Streptomyces sp. NPDC048644 TaxID=3365582 RepID=UPI00371CE2F4